jgi:hypothetical protein
MARRRRARRKPRRFGTLLHYQMPKLTHAPLGHKEMGLAVRITAIGEPASLKSGWGCQRITVGPWSGMIRDTGGQCLEMYER